jgi:hypothetical protein
MDFSIRRIALALAGLVAMASSGATQTSLPYGRPPPTQAKRVIEAAEAAIAQGKAETAVDSKRPTKVFDDMLGTGGVNLRVLGIPNTTPIDGGLSLIGDGRIVGAIGVSGMLPTQDAQVAEAGAAV